MTTCTTFNITAEDIGDDLCTVTKASWTFGVSPFKLQTAINHEIIHPKLRDGKYFLSRSEIQQNLHS